MTVHARGSRLIPWVFFFFVCAFRVGGDLRRASAGWGSNNTDYDETEQTIIQQTHTHTHTMENKDDDAGGPSDLPKITPRNSLGEGLATEEDDKETPQATVCSPPRPPSIPASRFFPLIRSTARSTGESGQQTRHTSTANIYFGRGCISKEIGEENPRRGKACAIAE